MKLSKKSETIVGNCIIDPSAKLGAGSKIGPNVVVGANVVIGPGVRLQNCCIMAGASIKDYALVQDSIVGWHSSVGRWARLDLCCVLGEDVHIKDEVFANGATVLPHKVCNSKIERRK